MRIFTILFLTCYFACSKAQEQALARVHYKFRHVNDTTKRDHPIRDDVVTYLGATSSLYMSYAENLVKADLDAQKLVTGFDGHLVVRLSTTPIKDFYFINSKEETIRWMQAISSSFDIYVLDHMYEKPTWEIGDKQQEIGGYLCQNATTSFKGRVYTAWFTSELPFSFGPWKLHGLPGLILSVSDNRGEVSFEYAGFEKMNTKDNNLVEVPFYAIEASQREIDRLRKFYFEDQGNYYKSIVGSGRFSLGTEFYGIDYKKNTVDMKFDEDYKPSFETNNPIEIVK